MQSFKNFISEERQIDTLRIETDSTVLKNNKDAMNADFDRLTAMPFQNPIIFYNQLRGTLERYGMIVPPGATKHFLNFDAELSMPLGESGLFLYVVFNTHKNTKVEGYAQIVDAEELQNLMNSDDAREEENEEDEDKEEEMEDDEDEMSDNEKYRKRKDDDSGDDSEY